MEINANVIVMVERELQNIVDIVLIPIEMYFQKIEQEDSNILYLKVLTYFRWNFKIKYLTKFLNIKKMYVSMAMIYC